MFSQAFRRIDASSTGREITSWIILLIGLTCWCGVQVGFFYDPVWNRALPPEVDDSLPYLMRTEIMEECPDNACPALKDLSQQLWVTSDTAEAEQIRDMARSPFPRYHRLFSWILMGLERLGYDLMTGYRILWTAGLIFFGLAFAYLLSAMFGKPAAGLALGMLAFRIFPDTGLHFVVPSNLAMGMAVIMWARIVQRKGDAPVAFLVGSALIVLMHPVGLIYSVFAALFAIAAYRPGSRRRMAPTIAVVSLLGAVGLLVMIIFNSEALPPIRVLPEGSNPFLTLLGKGFEALFTSVFVEVVRHEPAMFGWLPVVTAGAMFGFLVLPSESRKPIGLIIILYLLFLAGSLFYIQFQPGDLFFRIWIPFLVILFGLFGLGNWYVFRETARWAAGGFKGLNDDPIEALKSGRPAIVSLAFIGYVLITGAKGCEQMLAMKQHMKARQPLAFSRIQPELLMNHSEPGDAVMYSSILIMPYYFMHGALERGAVYYHPALAESSTTKERLSRPDVKFAAVYNPTVYHPNYVGAHERYWWTTSPAFVYSPIAKRKIQRPLSREGYIPASEFHYIDIEPSVDPAKKELRILFRNRGSTAKAALIPLDEKGLPEPRQAVPITIPGDYHDRMSVDMRQIDMARGFRLSFPSARKDLSIGGITFGDEGTRWPWKEKPAVTFIPIDWKTGPVTIHFDTSRLVPEPLSHKKLTVMDDTGSSVLLRIGSE